MNGNGSESIAMPAAEVTGSQGRRHKAKPPFATIEEAYALARKRLPRTLYHRLLNSSPQTYRENSRIFDDVLFRPRAATVFEDCDLRTTVLGNEISLPVLLASPGGNRLIHPQGEKAAAAAAGRAGTIDLVAMATGHRLEDVAAAASGPIWQQLYMSRGREAAEELIERAKAAGYQALVITVDIPLAPIRLIPGEKPPGTGLSRYNLYKFGFEAIQRPRWLTAYLLDYFNEKNVSAMERMSAAPGGPEARLHTGALTNRISATWEDFKWIGKLWGGPVVVKGILSGDDARRAVDVGASAVILSNHGGCGTLDTFPATLRMLPQVVAAVGSECEVLLDSGVRSGAHVVKAIALGARAVLIGRPYLMGLAAAGEAGIYQILEIYRKEINITLGGLGCPSVKALDPSYVEVLGNWPR